MIKNKLQRLQRWIITAKTRRRLPIPSDNTAPAVFACVPSLYPWVCFFPAQLEARDRLHVLRFKLPGRFFETFPKSWADPKVRKHIDVVHNLHRRDPAIAFENNEFLIVVRGSHHQNVVRRRQTFFDNAIRQVRKLLLLLIEYALDRFSLAFGLRDAWVMMIEQEARYF